MWSLPVAALATFTAALVTSAPFLPNLVISAHGMTLERSSATSTSSGCMSVKVVPSFTWFMTAALTGA